MNSFSKLFDQAAAHHGGAKSLEAQLPTPLSPKQLEAVGDDRYLAMMTKRIFQAGFVWRVVEHKWAGFETVFHGFDPFTMVMQSDIDLDKMAKDERIIRHRTKVASVRANAQFVLDIAQEHGSFGKFLAAWPGEDLIGLQKLLKKNAKRLGGNSGLYFLRLAGKDSWVMTNDAVTALKLEKVIDKEPTSQAELRAVQAAFNQWQQESGRPLAHISRVLACSIGPT